MSFVTSKALKVALEDFKSGSEKNLPKKVSQLENDKGFITQIQSISFEDIDSICQDSSKIVFNNFEVDCYVKTNMLDTEIFELYIKKQDLGLPDNIELTVYSDQGNDYFTIAPIINNVIYENQLITIKLEYYGGYPIGDDTITIKPDNFDLYLDSYQKDKAILNGEIQL